jgi:hypothetical protein
MMTLVEDMNVSEERAACTPTAPGVGVEATILPTLTLRDVQDMFNLLPDRFGRGLRAEASNQSRELLLNSENVRKALESNTLPLKTHHLDALRQNGVGDPTVNGASACNRH